LLYSQRGLIDSLFTLAPLQGQPKKKKNKNLFGDIFGQGKDKKKQLMTQEAEEVASSVLQKRK